MPVVSVVVPTYKEADNLADLCVALDDAMQRNGLDYELIIVDDLSPDDTAKKANQLAETYPLRLIQPVGRSRDLSLSVLDGIKEAAADMIVVMDADLSHPVEAIPELIQELQSGTKVFVAGSRYAQGGKFDRGWSFWRFLNSWCATSLAGPLTRCSDPMTGFFAVRKQDLPGIDRFKPIGYKIALEIMVRGEFENIVEIPITFSDRAAGESKMNLSQQFNYIRHLRRLYLFRFGGLAEFVHFVMVGASGFVVDVCIYYLLQAFGMDHRIARLISFWPAVSWNWALNRITTFGARTRRPRGRQLLEFVVTSCIGCGFNWGVYVSLTSRFPFFDDYRILALLAGIAGASLFNFMAATLFVYSEKRG
jgi:dolichol-phosphate mannosyltransferase